MGGNDSVDIVLSKISVELIVDEGLRVDVDFDVVVVVKRCVLLAVAGTRVMIAVDVFCVVCTGFWGFAFFFIFLFVCRNHNMKEKQNNIYKKIITTQKEKDVPLILA
jgi:hypothetical protein